MIAMIGAKPVSDRILPRACVRLREKQNLAMRRGTALTPGGRRDVEIEPSTGWPRSNRNQVASTLDRGGIRRR